MKTNIDIIRYFGDTVYNENDKAVFVQPDPKDLDNDNEVFAHINDIHNFSEAMKAPGYSITSIKGDTYYTDLPWDVYSEWQELGGIIMCEGRRLRIK